MKKNMYKIIQTISLSALAFLFLGSPQYSMAQTAPSCNNFSPAIYRISNNQGSNIFSVNAPVETRLTLQAKPGTSTGLADIVLVMDRTGSMGQVSAKPGSDPSVSTAQDPLQKKLKAAKAALHAAVASVRNAGNPGIRVALVVYNTSATLLQPLTTNFNAIDVAIDSITPYGGTSINAGLSEAGVELKNNSTINASKFIILASDGRQNTPDSTFNSIALALSRDVPPNTTIYTVGIGSDVTASYMERIAMAGTRKGQYYAADETNLTPVYQEIIGSIVSNLALKNVTASFMRDDMSHEDFVSAIPAQDSYDTVNGILKWNNVGDVSTVMSKTLGINYSTKVPGTNIPLNTSKVKVSYLIGSTQCTEEVPVNVLNINVLQAEPPPHVELTILPSTIYKDETAVVTWTVSGATDSCTATNGSSDWPGSKVFPEGEQTVGPFEPPQTIVYNLQCFGPGGASNIAEATLVVSPPIDGKCGKATETASRTAPTTDLCEVGEPTLVEKDMLSRVWKWQCLGTNKGEATECTAKVKWKIFIWEF